MFDPIAFLRRLGHAVAGLSHPPPSVLAPGVVAMLTWLILRNRWPFADPGVALTVAFCCSLGIMFLTRTARLRTRHPEHFAGISGYVGPLGLLLVISAVLLSQQSALWTQRYVSLHLGILALIYVADHLKGPNGDAWLWPRIDGPRLRRALSAGAFLWTLAALILNEYLIRYASLSDWLLAWAFAPVVLHYVSAMTNEVVILSAPDDDFSGPDAV